VIQLTYSLENEKKYILLLGLQLVIIFRETHLCSAAFMKASMWEPFLVVTRVELASHLVKIFKSRVMTSSFRKSDEGCRVYSRNVWVLYGIVTSVFSCWKHDREETPFFASFCIPHVLSSDYNKFWFHFSLTVFFLCIMYREETVK